MQTRVYWLDPSVGAWRVGRVLEGEGERFVVQFPNRDERVLPVQELYIRWDQPISDPAPYLALWVNETPLYANARSGFVHALVEQRAACQGMSGLLSAVIELEAHQVEVVRRVLQDPVQRYLLADEVGLGKTIEAGVLIRQYALDDPVHHKIVVIVPEPLVAQWKDELCRRFLLNVQKPGGQPCVISTVDLSGIASAVDHVGMLVVDEAHHLSSNPELYELLRAASAVVPRILLLSATPVLRNERGFLEMLHLLDPEIYSLDDEHAFRRKIAHRQSLAETVAGLVPENRLQMEDFLDSLVTRFADDDLLMAHVASLRAVLATLPIEDDPDFIDALLRVRSHLSDVYRLDRRILRNRRTGIGGLTPGRAGVTFVDYSSGAAFRLQEAVEVWRSAAALAVYGKKESESSRQTAEWFADLLGEAVSDPATMLVRVQTTDPVGSIPLDDLRATAEALICDDARSG